ncbi:hypothetical protein PCE1_002023 [Barthelona sp. PCE]
MAFNPLFAFVNTLVPDLLKENKRMDGREFNSMRSIDLKILSDFGVQISFGQTVIVARVSAEVVEPLPHRPFSGFFKTSLKTLGSNTDLRQEVNSVIQTVMRQSRLLNLDSLCVSVGQSVYEVVLNVVIVQDDGNCFDAAILAASCAMACFRLPDGNPLNIQNLPVGVTFATLESDGDPLLLLDPTSEELAACSGAITVAVNEYREVCSIFQPGGVLLGVDALKNVIEMALTASKSYLEVIASVSEK